MGGELERQEMLKGSGVSCRHRVALAGHRVRQYNRRSLRQFLHRCPWIEGNQEPERAHPSMGREMTQWKRPSRHVAVHSHLQLQFSRIHCCLLSSGDTAHGCAQTHAQTAIKDSQLAGFNRSGPRAETSH